MVKHLRSLLHIMFASVVSITALNIFLYSLPILCSNFDVDFRRYPQVPSEMIPISPPNSYSLDRSGLHMYLTKPSGAITTSNGVNNRVADGCTFNGTTLFL